MDLPVDVIFYNWWVRLSVAWLRFPDPAAPYWYHPAFFFVYLCQLQSTVLLKVHVQTYSLNTFVEMIPEYKIAKYSKIQHVNTLAEKIMTAISFHFKVAGKAWMCNDCAKYYSTTSEYNLFEIKHKWNSGLF